MVLGTFAIPAPVAASTQLTEAQHVIRIAANQIGSRYQFAGTGPNAFDCSGFVYYVFKRADLLQPNRRPPAHGFGLPQVVREPRKGHQEPEDRAQGRPVGLGPQQAHRYLRRQRLRDQRPRQSVRRPASPRQRYSSAAARRPARSSRTLGNNGRGAASGLRRGNRSPRCPVRRSTEIRPRPAPSRPRCLSRAHPRRRASR